jgi:phosphoglycolate phosphatase-like HAD superfamily hydrolase
MQTAALRDFDDVVFDFDGTLARLRVDWQSLRAAVAHRFPDCVPAGQCVKISSLMEAIGARYGTQGRSVVAEIVRQHEQPGGAPDVEQIVDSVRAARALRRFDVISNNLVSTVWRSLEAIGLASTCRHVIGFDSVERSKPAEEPYRALQAAVPLGKRVLYVGDRQSDRLFALNVGISFLHVSEVCA